MVNKNKTIINNKNIIKICGTTRKHQKQNSKSKSTPSTNINIDNPRIIRDTPIYNSFPNSTSLEDESRKIRFLQAMRDPTSTKSPYSIFDNGSNTFQREGNTPGYEEPATQQINPDEYFDEPQQPQFTQPQFRSASISSQSFIPRTVNRTVRIQATPSAFLETPNRNDVSPITLGGTTRFNLEDDGFDDVNIGELGGFEQPDITSKTYGGYYETPFVGLSQEELDRQEKEAIRLEKINRGRRAREEEQKIEEDRENETMGNEDKRERQRLKEEREQKLEEERERDRLFNEKLQSIKENETMGDEERRERERLYNEKQQKLRE